MSDEALDTSTVDQLIVDAGLEIPESTEYADEEVAAPPKEEEKPKDPKASEEKRKEELRAKRVAEHLKREAQLRRQAESFEQERAQATQQLTQQYEHLTTIKSQMERMYEEAASNPYKWLQDNFGVGPEQYFEFASRGGEPPQDHALSQLERKFQEKLERLEGKLTQAEQDKLEALHRLELEDQERKTAQQRRAQQEAYVAAQAEFMSEVRDNADAYPDLQYYSDDDILSELTQMVGLLEQQAQRQYEETGNQAFLQNLKNLSYNDLASALQAGVAEQHQKIRSGPPRPKQGTQPSAPQRSAKTGPPVVTRRLPAKPELDHTLSNTMSASRGSAKNTFDDVDYDQLRAELIRELERSSRE